MTAPTNLATMMAEIKALIFVNGVGGITATMLQTVLLDTLNVLGAVATAAAQVEADAEITAATPGLLVAAAASGTTAGASAGTSSGAAAAQPYATAAQASATAAQAILNTFLDDGIQGSGTVVLLDDGVQN